MSPPATKSAADRAIAALARKQDRVVARRQLLAAGVGAGAIKERTASGVLVVMHRGVYSLGAPSERGRLRAALLVVGDEALLSRLAAAYVHGLLDGERPKILDVSTPRCVAPRAGLEIHREAVPVRETRIVARYRATGIPRTLLDLAATAPRRRVERIIDQAERLERYDRDAVAAALRSEHPGAGALAAILAAHSPGTTITRSELEERFFALCGSYGIARPLLNTPLVLPGGRRIVVDALWPVERVSVELDGRLAHLRRKAFESDRARDVELTVSGYLPARFTWRQVTRESRWVAAQLRGLLARGSSLRT